MTEERIFQKPARGYSAPDIYQRAQLTGTLAPRPWVPLKSWPVAEHPRQIDLWRFRSLPSLYRETEW